MWNENELDVAQVMPSMRKYLRTALSLKTMPVDGTKLTRGQSRIGGEPDLPQGFQWPENESGPLSFIAQIDLTEVAKIPRVLPLPPVGSLLFFYDATQKAWGDDPKDLNSFKVIHVETPAHELIRTPFPENLDRYGRFKAASICMRRILTLPPSDWGRFDPPLSKAESDWTMAFNDVHPHYPYHWLGGHACFVQNAMEKECQLVSNGVDCGNVKPQNSECVNALISGAEDWRLLLQITTDDDLEMMWGDCGIIFFWIREQDLIDRRFEKCWVILQCC